MKRSVLIMLTSVLIFLTACRSEAPALTSSFCCEASVSGGELNFTARVECRPEEVVIEVTSPATVAGVRYTYSGGELRTSFEGLDSVSGISSLPSSAAPAILCEALSRLSEAQHKASDSSGDAYLLHLRAGDAVIIAEDGNIRSLSVDYSPCVVTFTRFD